MKLVSKLPAADGTPGSCKVIPEDAEDMWHLYNTIAAGDRVQATTVRKVAFDSASGERESERVKLRLTLAVEAVDYDAAAAQLRVRGRNLTECEHVKLGGARALRSLAGALSALTPSAHNVQRTTRLSWKSPAPSQSKKTPGTARTWSACKAPATPPQAQTWQQCSSRRASHTCASWAQARRWFARA